MVKANFPTPRILLEIRQGNRKWRPVEITTRFQTVQAAIHALPRFAARYGVELTDMRAKHLPTDKAIFEAKLAIDEAQRKEDQQRHQ